MSSLRQEEGIHQRRPLMYPSSISTTHVPRVKVRRYNYGAQLTWGCTTHKVNGTKQWLNQVV